MKRTCSSSNKLIRFLKNYLGIKHSIELKELIKGNNKKDDKWPRNGHVCRICLKSNEGEYTKFSDAKTDEYGSTLTSCLSTLVSAGADFSRNQPANCIKKRNVFENDLK